MHKCCPNFDDDQQAQSAAMGAEQWSADLWQRQWTDPSARGWSGCAAPAETSHTSRSGGNQWESRPVQRTTATHRRHALHALEQHDSRGRWTFEGWGHLHDDHQASGWPP